MGKKILSILMAVVLCVSLFSVCAVSVSADNDRVCGDYEYVMWGDGASVWRYNGTEKNLKIPSTLDGYPVVRISGWVFSNNHNLKSVEIPEGVTYIGQAVFYHCANLKSVTIPKSVTEIKSSVFSGCTSLESVTLPSGITEISECLFEDCQSLKTFTIPSGVTAIKLAAFEGCTSLKSITIPVGVKTIGDNVFNECESLKSITIPASVKTINQGAFYDCNSLKEVYYGGTSAKRETMNIGYANENLTNLKWHYSSSASNPKHTYSGACDKTCNICSKTRTASSHKYTNVCDTSCNVCKSTRSIKHTYKTVTTKATFDKSGSVEKRCKVCNKLASKTAIKRVKTVKLSAATYTYDGKTKMPTVVVKDVNGKTLKKNTDYTVTYASGRKNVGTYKVTVKLKGNYSGKKVLTFTIHPPKTTVSKLTAGKKSVVVNIAKKTTQVKGYQIQYSTSKSFAKSTVKTMQGSSLTSCKLWNLTSGKTYYVRVRTYKIVGSKKIYSDWSAIKAVKTKK